ncbi:MAG: LLM class flavin-dependent oxidoreductase [Alphaproteobacteria bacterium]|jgi:alkanesulfonate monooxygenase SsuD/methylene tetrahydromethanopterin reductase-like flavin-dependent oxidoreductase (luciferase family)|nr:LLM class flavin-dependent oxidoreductase [Alphaproteobacteria bacterium]
MDFGLFNLLQHRDRATSPHQVIAEALEHTRLAEELGYSRVWFAEHHFSNYSLCPSPMILCTQAAAITSRIRVGSAVLILPLHEPARVIAEIALVDALSGGRLDVGVGSGYQQYEFERLGADISQNKVVFNEMLDMIERGLRQANFSYKGEFFEQLQTAINVRPVQKPRPPIWVAGADPNSHKRCARDGYIPFISGGIDGPERIKSMRDQIEQCYVEEGKDPATVPLGVLRFVCINDDQAIIDRYVDGARYQKRIAMALRHRRETMIDDYMVDEAPFPDEPSIDQIAKNVVVGTAEAVAERLCQEIELYGPRHMSLYFAVGDLPSAAVMNSMEQFSTKVVPMIEAHFGKPLAEICDVPLPTPSLEMRDQAAAE